MLTFILKKNWYDKIESGCKKVEYREVKPYWTSRLKNAADNIFPVVFFGFPEKYGDYFEYDSESKLFCYFQLGYKPGKRLKARITKIEVKNGLNTDLGINGLVYAIHFTDVTEC